MAKVRSTGNQSTEMKVQAVLTDAGIAGWTKHPKDILGKPDFYFPDVKLVLFVDGCFWHSCAFCARKLPSTRTEFWKNKIDTNRRRDNRKRRKLRAMGFHVMRVWEHDLKNEKWLKRLRGPNKNAILGKTLAWQKNWFPTDFGPWSAASAPPSRSPRHTRQTAGS